jgi:hypothetical protein
MLRIPILYVTAEVFTLNATAGLVASDAVPVVAVDDATAIVEAAGIKARVHVSI